MLSEGLTPGAAAEAYAKQKWPVFPVAPRDKRPLVNAWVQAATVDVGQVREWWEEWPDANIGFVPGRALLLVVDIDSFEAQERAQSFGFYDNPVPIVGTGRGKHLYFLHPEPGTEIGNCPVLGRGFDIRCNKGYVLLPPSLHPSGRRYTWQEIPREPPSLPGPVRRLVLGWVHRRSAPAGGNPPGEAPVLSASWGAPIGGVPFLGSGPIPEGQRNMTLLRLAGHHRGRGASEEEVRAEILHANVIRCSPPLPVEELEQTIFKSVPGWVPGQRKPGRRSKPARVWWGPTP